MDELRANLPQLRVLDILARTGSITRTAAALSLTPGAVSQQLRQLEATLGIALYRREGRSVRLTSQGSQLAGRIEPAFDTLQSVLGDLRSQNGKRLRLALLPTFAFKWLAPRAATFYAMQPGINLEITTVSEACNDIPENADIALRHGLGEWTDVEFDHVFDDEFILVCSPVLASQITCPADVLRFKMLHSMMRPTVWRMWAQSAGLDCEEHPMGIEVANAALCCQLAEEGVGVTVVQKEYVRFDCESGRLVQPIPHCAKNQAGYYVVYARQRSGDVSVRSFRKWIRSQKK